MQGVCVVVLLSDFAREYEDEISAGVHLYMSGDWKHSGKQLICPGDRDCEVTYTRKFRMALVDVLTGIDTVGHATRRIAREQHRVSMRISQLGDDLNTILSLFRGIMICGIPLIWSVLPKMELVETDDQEKRVGEERAR